MRQTRETRAGFTLIELLVVVLIIGILTALTIPQYTKTVESGKAESAGGVVRAIGNANRMFKLDHGRFVDQGRITSACGSDCCYGDSGCGSSEFAACQLVACNYLADDNYDDGDVSDPYKYTFEAGNSNANCGLGSNGIACASRDSGGPTVSQGWGYLMEPNGKMNSFGDAPDLAGG